MEHFKKTRVIRLNGYSWSIIVAFLCATFAMHYHASNSFFKDSFLALPLIIVAVYWCQQSKYSITQPEYNLKNTDVFHRDCFLISFSFLLSCLISLIFAYNNSDAKGWWIFIIYFITLYGLFFSLIFSLIALLIKNHKIYTITYSFIIIIFISFAKYSPLHISLPFLSRIDIFFLITGLLLIIHCLLAIGYKVIRLFFNAKRSNNSQG